ncbi:hypothetical protein FISHEDRAFT_46795 [Fistulina hepatica ATCC 64428]|uniref:Dynamin-type G domain-containing protein n=1 Tax=Fistulina hepatica ATCC 64428 TaxID=1128425 RepID=A0A0D7A7B3_9AGAR|nr:hypothetical protein FISHEDRAFT_46795 [Fistulina hepatica ATCC 64428]
MGNGEKQLRVDDVQEAYVEHKDRLVTAIDSTTSILNDIRKFNKEEWVVRYPFMRPSDLPASESVKTRKGLHRSMSFADDPAAETEVLVSQDPTRGMQRSISLASILEANAEDMDDGIDKSAPSSDFQILRLDLKLGAASNPSTVVSQLEKASIANLLDERVGSSIAHIAKLRNRVLDTSSKVLVTGDLNAGKSTFVNALLRREVMPVDQQPCTTAFCEVHDAAENGGKEEVHITKEGVAYDLTDESTFIREPLEKLEQIVDDFEHEAPDKHVLIRIYLADTRAPSESLLNNGVVDISLIDAPGLNRDSLKTTAVFARQEEIDVVVFVVSAENHFTLSAKEFLWNASNEKAYLFIVVNKFDQIRNKEKCKRLVLDQIRQLSPGTYEDAEDLVHFVDSEAALKPYTANPAFDDLESALRSFVLVKRSQSKLGPVSTYLSNLLADVELLSGANKLFADREVAEAQAELDVKRPILEKMAKGRDALEEGLERVEEEGATKASVATKRRLDVALENVGQGTLGVVSDSLKMPSWSGLFNVFDYAREVRKTLLASLDMAVKFAEDEARVIATEGVQNVKDFGEEHLPEGVERSRRVFMPEAMFSAVRRSNKGNARKRRSSVGGSVVAGGTVGLGLGLAQRSDMTETTFFDILDVSHHFWAHLGNEKSEDDESMPSALGVISVGLGALTMVGGQAVGARGVIEGVIRLADLFASETTRKWAAPVLGAFTIGMTAYFVLELPASIPRTVGRRVRASVQRDGDGDYVVAHAARIARETRKVLRLASWDLRERFRTAMAERGKEVEGMEDMERRAMKAQAWFEEVAQRTAEVRKQAALQA